jgi:mannose-1-phosphate guanylyltransferase
MLHALIMAGGSGTRFWPESRAALPKQLLRLADNRTLIRSTFDRLADVVKPAQTLILTNQRLVERIASELPELPADRILGEPCKRDTAPCIGLAALLVMSDDPEATMVVLPADHVITPSDAFAGAIQYATRLVEELPARLVTFGIAPTYPAEVFGYIERGAKLDTAVAREAIAPPTYHVARFREKPQADVAREYLATGRFYWNAGIFVWKAKTIVAALDQHQPAMMGPLRTIAAAYGQPNFGDVFAAEFAKIRGISIDFAVMEQAQEVAVVQAPFAWDDVGSWRALARVHGQDADGNTIRGKHLGWNTRGAIIRSSDDHLVVTMGVEDLIIVHTPDVTLVADKRDEESIRRMVEELSARGWSEFL